MPRFFIDSAPSEEGRATITGGDAHHIFSVLRMRCGEELTCCDFFGNEYSCRILACESGRVELQVLGSRKTESEPPFEITLLMALPKGDKMDLIVQKAVELGVTRIVPFHSRYTVVRLDEKTAAKKTERWQKIAKSAAEQSGRGRIPEICPPTTLKALLDEYRAEDALKILCYEGEEKLTLKAALEEHPAPSKIVFMVGAEGGIDRTEAEEAGNAGFTAVTLGRRILRCETAPLCVLAQISYVYEY